MAVLPCMAGAESAAAAERLRSKEKALCVTQDQIRQELYDCFGSRPVASMETTMANNAFPYTPELKLFQAADDAWSEELARLTRLTHERAERLGIRNVFT
jgi:hypothetical protein